MGVGAVRGECRASDGRRREVGTEERKDRGRVCVCEREREIGGREKGSRKRGREGGGKTKRLE
jgi:hypothetical protein